MLWRTEIPSGVVIEDVIARMLEAGWSSVNPSPILYTLEMPEGHLLVIVPRTGRVQIRLDFDTPRMERARIAAAVHDQLLRFF